jgi:hypothetical protein
MKIWTYIYFMVYNSGLQSEVHVMFHEGVGKNKPRVPSADIMYTY